MVGYGVAADGRTLLPECDGPARTCQTAERRAMSRMSRSRLGHASPRLAVQDRFGPRWLGASAKHSPSCDYRPGLDRAVLRSFGLASDILGNAATLGPCQESRIMVRPLRGRHAFASPCPGADLRQAGCGTRVDVTWTAALAATAGAFPLREPIRLPCLPPSALSLRATGRPHPLRRIPLHAPRRLAGITPAVDPSRSSVRPLTNRAFHVQQQDAHRRRAPGRDPGRGAQR